MRQVPKRLLPVGISVLLAAALCLSGWLLPRRETAPHFQLRGDYPITFSNLDKVVLTLHDALEDHASAVTISFSVEGNYMGQVESIVDELMDLALDYSVSFKDGPYLRYQYGGYTLSYAYKEKGEQRGYTVTINPTYYTTLSEEAQVDEKVAEILAELDLSQTDPEEEKIRAVYDYVCSHVSYDYVHVRSARYYSDSTAYAALVKGYASCQGYAVTLYRLLEEVGVTNTIVTGTAVNELGEEEFHAWNKVELNGTAYHLDATWDAGKEEYQFFLRTDSELTRHTED